MNNVVKFPVPQINTENKKHDKIMNILSASAYAIEPVASARIAACIVLKNKIISFGYCQKKTHPLQKKYGKNNECVYLHAEIDAIRNALNFYDISDLKKATLYVCRVKSDSKNHKKMVLGLAKPCCGCQRAIANFELKNVIYSTEEGYEEW